MIACGFSLNGPHGLECYGVDVMTAPPVPVFLHRCWFTLSQSENKGSVFIDII